MARSSGFKVVPPHPKAPLIAKRSTLKPQNRQVEHVVHGVGNLLHVRPLDGGIFAAVVEFGGVERTIRLAPEYWVTPITEIMALDPHLSSPLKSVVKKGKANSAPDVAEDVEPELGQERIEGDDGDEAGSEEEADMEFAGSAT